MEKFEQNDREYYSIDLLHVARSLLRRLWLIVAVGVLTGAAGFFYSNYAIDPSYSSHVKLYVNNSSFSLGNSSFSISPSDLTASQSLIKTYGEILNTRTTLERIIQKSGVDYSWKQLSKMIDCTPSNGTEIMLVTVTCGDPYKASKIANTIAEVLPARISEIIDGATMEVVDSAIPELDKVSPSIAKYTAVGMLFGGLFTVIVLVVVTLLDDTIHNEEYVLQNYGFPILGRVPDLLSSGGKSSYYYTRKSEDVQK